MKATLVDLRRNARQIVEAIERNETVTLTKRGKEIAQIIPTKEEPKKVSFMDSPAFGMWKDREDMADPVAYVRKIRQPRYRDI